MGNCLRTQSSRSWVDDDEDDFDLTDDQTPELRRFIRGRSSADGDLGGTDGGFGLGDHRGHDQKVIPTEVKIKVTKKQLEKLVSLVGMQGMSVEELLEKVASLGGYRKQDAAQALEAGVAKHSGGGLRRRL